MLEVKVVCIPILVVLSAAMISCRPSERAGGKPDQIRELSVSQLKDWMSQRRTYALIDVREDDEWSSGHAAGALHIPRWTLASRLAGTVPDKNATIVLYCRSGVRSAAAAATLRRLGYCNVFSLMGGFKQYQAAGLPVL